MALPKAWRGHGRRTYKTTLRGYELFLSTQQRAYSLFLLSQWDVPIIQYNKSCYHGLELAMQILVTSLTICGGSELIVKQPHGEYSVRKTEQVPIIKRPEQLLRQFEEVKIFHVRRALKHWLCIADSGNLSVCPKRKVSHIVIVGRRLLTHLT